METNHAMNKQKLLRELRQVSKHCTERIKVYTEARKQIQNTIRKIKSPAPTPEPTGDIPIEIIAELLGKGKISKAGKTKAVKRATIGIKPIGLDGIDYRKVIATQTHVKDHTAHYAGEEVYVFIQGRTKFRANDVRHLWQDTP